MTDDEALAAIARSSSGEAFTALVNRYANLVYSTATRIARDAHLAEDVTQAVFLVLARRGNSINPKYLAGWLVNATRLAARDALRTRVRQQKRDVEAARMRPEVQPGDEPTFEQISPLLDDALARLSESDRSAVVLRFLQGRSFLEVAAVAGVSEDAARKRVARAVEKLRKYLLKQGVAPGIGGLTVILAAHQATAAPIGLSARLAVAAASPPTTAVASIAKGLVWTMKIANAKIALIVLFLTFSGIGGGEFFMLAVRRVSAAPPSTAPSVPPTSQPLVADKVADDRIQPDDRLRIKIQDLVGLGVETQIRARVDSSGKIPVPLIGQVQAGGKTLSQVQAEITDAYREGQIINNAQVQVEFDEQGATVSIRSAPCDVGDHILFRVNDLAGLGVETTAVYVVDADGNIPTPAFDRRGAPNPPELAKVHVQGLSEYEAERKITKAYRSAQVLMNAQVQIERISAKEAADYAAQPKMTPSNQQGVLPRHAGVSRQDSPAQVGGF